MNKIQIISPLAFVLIYAFLAFLPAIASADATLNAVYTLQTGTVPFDGDDLPGNDSSNSNFVVRTNDSLVISYQVGVDNENETNIVFRVMGGPNIDFDLPPFCLTSGVTPPSGITGTVSSGEIVTCNIGDKSAGSATSVSIPGRVMPTLMNGSSVSIVSTSVAGDTSGMQSFPGATVTVSASPKFDIFKNTGSGLKGSALGPNGEKGLVQIYPIGIKLRDKGFGAEHASSDIIISDDLSGISPNALLYQGWAGAPAKACFSNGALPTYQINSLPYGYTQAADGGPGGVGEGPAANSVFNSGSFTCPSVSAGGTTTISITGADLSGVHYPEKAINNNALSVDEQFLVSGVLVVWFPVQDIIDNNNELTISNEYIAQSFTGVSGQTNVDPSNANNSKSYVLRETSPGNGRYFFIGKNNGGAKLEGQTSGRSGDGSLVAGQSFNTAQRQSNGQAYSETDYNNLNLCTSFDNTKQIVRKRSGRYADVTFTGTPRITQPAFTIEYGTGAFGASVTCENADSPDGWVSDPTALPGGIASVTKVRGVGNLIAPRDALDPTRAQLRIYYTALTSPVGTVLPQWGTYRSDNFNNGDWVLSDYDATTALGGWGDRATITAVVVRISKDTNPSAQNSVAAGNILSFELDWSATLFGTPPNPTTPVTITDTLPKEYSLIAGSSSLTPTSVSNNADGSTRVIWLIPSASINASQIPITYDVLVKNTTADGTGVANTVVISSPDDPTPEASRTDTYSMSILNTSILSLFKEATPSKMGLDAAYGYVLSYANTGSGPLTNLQMIDVLPDNAWSRNPVTSFVGTSTLLSVTGSNGEVFEYTKTPAGSLSQNPTDTSNQPGGSTVWCSSFSGGSCPASGAEVTAFRATLSGMLSPTDGVKEVHVDLQANDNSPTNTYTNNFTAVADELAISVTSVTAKTLVEVTYDHSDAPSDYGVAKHGVLESLVLGPTISSESAALFSPNADSDVSDDGVTFPIMTQGESVELSVAIRQPAANAGYLQAWIDWNGDGDFDDSVDRIPEQISINTQDNTSGVSGRTDDSNAALGQIGIAVTIPPSATHSTFARFRWSTTPDLTPSGSADDGEVEDYQVSINANTGCLLGSGAADPLVTPYISAEVKGTTVSARNAVDALDDSWRTAAGLLNSGKVVPWFDPVAIDPLGNNELDLFTTNGVSVDVALVNIEPVDSCVGAINSAGSPALSQSSSLQASAPRPASLYHSSSQPAFWNETPPGGDNSSPNAVRFTFDTPVSHFGAWFGDMETRSDGYAAPAYLRLLDTSGNRIGKDIPIEPTDINDGGVISVIDQSQCGSSATNIGCGNSATRWVGFVDSAGVARVKQVLVIVGDDDFGDDADLEHLSFIGADIVSPGQPLKGVVFEDINYGGGAGRDQTAASGAGINGVTVELYNGSGAFVGSTTTLNDGGIDGVYEFASVPDGGYFVRVVSDTVSSTRPGSDGSELAVQTFRTDGVTAMTNEVGGRAPALVDGVAYDSGSPSTLNTTSFVFSGGALDSQQAQSVQSVTVASAEVAGVDFGFNFDTIVNANDSGQGSLRQFILNSNLLANTGLDQVDNPTDGAVDPAAGVETSIFEIPANSVHTITLDSPLPAVTDAFTALDASTQQGANCVAGSRSLRVQLDGVNAGINGQGIRIDAANATIRGFSVGQFSAQGIYASANADQLRVACSHIGLAADGITAFANNKDGILIQGAANTFIGGDDTTEANIIAHNTGDAITISGAGANNNRVSRNRLYANGGLGVDLDQNDVTLNDGGDIDTGFGNEGINFPQFSQITLVGGDLTIEGCAPANATIELFEADVSPSSGSGASAGDNQFAQTQDYGEGESYLVGWVMPASGTVCAMSVDDDGNNPAGMLAFSQTFAVSGLAAGSNVVLGDQLTATATVAGKGTSEFSAVSLVSSFDYGDAPDRYGTTQATTGPQHGIVNNVYLGSNQPDAESDGQPGVSANDDGTDEDGIISFPVLSRRDRAYSLVVQVTNGSSVEANLVAWIDFDGNGRFDSNEAAIRSVAAGVSASLVTLTWSAIPLDIQAGDTYLRLRLTTDSLTNREPIGAKRDGEVEDYSIRIITTGVTVSGRVFRDVNVNAANDASEVGVTQLPVVLYDTVAKTCVSTRTNRDGDYQFTKVLPGTYQVYEASRHKVPVPVDCGPSFAKDPGGYRSTTDNVRTAFTVLASDITGQDFGDVKPPIFGPDHRNQILPGNVLFYAHRFSTPTKGSVRFNSESTANISTGWRSLIYRDHNCNGRLDGIEAVAAMSGTQSNVTTWSSDSVNVTAGNKVCLINKVYAPANVAANDRYVQNITANFDYGNAIAGNQALRVQDVTIAKQVQVPTTPQTPEVVATPAVSSQPAQPATPNIPATPTAAEVPSTPYTPATDSEPAQISVAATPVVPEVGPSRLVLRKTVRNVSQGSAETATVNSAEPGDTLEYRIYYRNAGTGPITDLVVNDSVPPFTRMLGSASCGSLLAGMGCTVSSPGLGDALKWTFTGVLTGGSEGAVSYQVQIDD